MSMPPDLQIAQKTKLLPIAEVAESIGLGQDDIEFYGKYKAKVLLSVLERLRDRPNGKYVVVTGITPTPLGEGKTVTTIGLAQGLARIGKKSACCIRQAAMGPVFGIKGGAAGGGYSQVVPMEDFNLHLTGDLHAVSSAHALLSAMVDTLLVKGNPARLDPAKITWRRCVDMNDMALRNIVIGLGANGIPRETGFDLTSASEIMSILGLSTSAADLRKRLGRIVVGFTHQDLPAFAEGLRAAGAMAVLLKDAIKPNLMQTIEHVPAFVHTSPFANISHGSSSVLADQIALKCCDFVVTESGFGADIGLEKFLNIKCRVSGLIPDAVCLVVSVRAVKAHSGRFRVVPGQPIDPRIFEPDTQALREGLVNLTKHLENVRHFGLPSVAAINQFPTDSTAEIDMLRDGAQVGGATQVVVSQVHTKGGQGGAALADAVVGAAEMPREPFRFLYELDAAITDKIETVATQIYGAVGVHYESQALKAIDKFTKLGWGRLPICIAKTQYSLSHDANWKGRPHGFRFPVRDVRVASGAGYLYPLAGTIQTMPALGRHPAAMNMDIDADGTISGLF